MKGDAAAAGLATTLNLRFPFAEDSCIKVTRIKTERLEWSKKCHPVGLAVSPPATCNPQR
jgi:hypothetical protein